MRVVIQRSLQATVQIDDKIVGKINHGLVILVGVSETDTIDDVYYLVRKISQLRIFNDNDNKMNLDIKQVNGQILSISQFTLLANTKKGNRPNFTQAAHPNKANAMYELFNTTLAQKGIDVQTGQFGADMAVSLVNDGPVTIVIDSKNKG